MTQTHHAGQALETAVRRPGLEAAAPLEPIELVRHAAPPRRQHCTTVAILCQASPQAPGEEALTVALEAATRTSLLPVREAASRGSEPGRPPLLDRTMEAAAYSVILQSFSPRFAGQSADILCQAPLQAAGEDAGPPSGGPARTSEGCLSETHPLASSETHPLASELPKAASLKFTL